MSAGSSQSNSSLPEKGGFAGRETEELIVMAEVRQRWRKVIGNTGLIKKKQSSDPAVLCPASANGLKSFVCQVAYL